jgi:hypothetical protein
MRERGPKISDRARALDLMLTVSQLYSRTLCNECYFGIVVDSMKWNPPFLY